MYSEKASGNEKRDCRAALAMTEPQPQVLGLIEMEKPRHLDDGAKPKDRKRDSEKTSGN